MMRSKTRQISEDQYMRAMLNGGFLTKEDQRIVFTDAERLGYGASAGSVFISPDDGKPYVLYSISDTCD